MHLSSMSLFSSSWKTQGRTLFSSFPSERLSGTKILFLISGSVVNHESLSSALIRSLREIKWRIYICILILWQKVLLCILPCSLQAHTWLKQNTYLESGYLPAEHARTGTRNPVPAQAPLTLSCKKWTRTREFLFSHSHKMMLFDYWKSSKNIFHQRRGTTKVGSLHFLIFKRTLPYEYIAIRKCEY